MKYYKLSMDMERENDIICHFQNDYGIQQNALNTGKVFENWGPDGDRRRAACAFRSL